MNAHSILLEIVSDSEKYYAEFMVKNPGVKPDALKSFWAARDSWIQRGKINELIYFIHSNWKFNFCDPFAEPLESHLISTKQVEYYIKFWEPIINGRISYLADSLEKLLAEESPVDFKKMETLDNSSFNVYSKEARKDLKKLVAYNRKLALGGIHRYFNGLTSLGEIEKAIRVDKVFIAISEFKIQKLP